MTTEEKITAIEEFVAWSDSEKLVYLSQRARLTAYEEKLRGEDHRALIKRLISLTEDLAGQAREYEDVTPRAAEILALLRAAESAA